MNPILIIGQNTIKALIRKKDFYVFFIMLVVLMIVLNLQNFYDIKGISRFIKESGYSATWVFSFILATIFTSKQLIEEANNKTIYSLLSKPVSLLHIVLGRYLGSILSVSVAFSVFYVFYIFSISFRGEGIGVLLIFQGYFLGVLFLSMACAVALLLSLLLTYSAAVTFSFILYFVVVILSEPLRAVTLNAQGFLKYLLHFIYYILPHYEFYDIGIRIVHGWQALPMWVVFAVTIYTAVFVSVILFFCHLIINKRIF